MLSVATPEVLRTRDRLAGSGAAVGVRAPFEAVKEALEALGRDAGLVLIFPTGVLDPQEAATQAQAAAGDARVAGMTGTGAITSSGAIESGCSAIAFDSSLPVGVGASTSSDPRAAGRSAAAEALFGVDRDGSHAALLLFVDSESGDQAEIVAGAYEIAGGRIPLAGGAAGGQAMSPVRRRRGVVGGRGRRRPRQQDADRCRHCARLCATRSALDRHPLARPGRASTGRPSCRGCLPREARDG